MNHVRNEIKKAYEQCQKGRKISLITAFVVLPSGATEMIVNTTHSQQKLEYYLNAYDEDMRLVVNPVIHIKNIVITYA